MSWGLAWAAAGVFPFALPDPALVLAPAAAAVALIAGSAVAAVEHDLRRAGFGWRQALLPLAVVASFVGALPALGAAESGRWAMPRGGFDEILPFEDPMTEGSYRVLWIGAPEHLPCPAGAWSGTRRGRSHRRAAPGRRSDGAPTPDQRAWCNDAYERALGGETLRVGRRLGVLGIRYVVVLDRVAPAPFSDHVLAVPEEVETAFARQLDLRRLDGVNSALDLCVNTEWLSVRAAAPGLRRRSAFRRRCRRSADRGHRRCARRSLGAARR
ncbi:MAG: hypothetical protein R2695_03640 [Acidimicrobiales bacterium]